MTLSIRSLSFLLVVAVSLLTPSQAFTAVPKVFPYTIATIRPFSNDLSLPHGNDVVPSPPPFISNSWLTLQAVATTSCHDTTTTSSLRSRVGTALGGIQRRLLFQTPRVEVIEDVSNFDAILKSTKEQFVAVFFHSPVCKACQAAAPHFYKLSQKYSNVKFLSVPLTPDNKATLQQDLGVKKFPFGHIYHSQHGLLDELPILRKLVPHFEERLRSHVSAWSMGTFPDTTTAKSKKLDQVIDDACTE